MSATGTRGDAARGARVFSVVAPAILVVLGLLLAWFNQLPGLPRDGQVVPLISSLVGVTFYLLYNVRKRRGRFDLAYLPDYLFRAAQAVVYVYAILAMFDYLRSEGEAAGQALLRWPPNLIGLFVGMYILHVERAMESLGYRFEEALTGVLGRSLSLATRREKDIQFVQAEGRLREMQKQAELMAAETGPSALVEGLKQRFRQASDAIAERDDDSAVKEIAELSLDFERTKRELRREARTVSRVLDMVQAQSPGPLSIAPAREPREGDDVPRQSDDSPAGPRESGAPAGEVKDRRKKGPGD